VYVVSWTVMTSFGYNTAAMAQRYFSVDDERSARKVALLCFSLFFVGAFIWFIPPLAMRVAHPDLNALWPGLANPQESSYALAAVTLLPNGLIGIMLAAMLSATMSSVSGLLNLHSAIISRDIFPTLFPGRAGDAEKLAVGWASTFGVGATMIALAMTMAAQGQSVFQVMLTFNTVMSLAYGPPALLGLVVKRTPRWSGFVSFGIALLIGCWGSFVLGWGLVANVWVVVPVATAVFLLSHLADRAAPRREELFERLETPVDKEAELAHSPDPTTRVFRFLSRATGAVGALSLLLLFSAAPGDRVTVVAYVAVTLAVSYGLSRVRGEQRATVTKE
jgi:Na+/proline symporter